MKCFISREYSVSSEILISIQEVLDELNIQYYDMFPVQGGMAISEAIYTAIHDSDIVIAVITKSSSNVLFELGLAIGLGKAVFLLVDDSDYIPADLHGRLYIKINENLKENLTLPLRFFVDKKRKKNICGLYKILFKWGKGCKHFYIRKYVFREIGGNKTEWRWFPI